MNRLLIDCSGVDFSRQPTGIPRVVVKYLDTGYEWGAKNNVEVIPVICTSNGVLLVRPPPGRSPPESLKLLSDQSAKIEPGLIDSLVPRTLGYLGRIATSLLTLIAAIVPLPILEDSAKALEAKTNKSAALLKAKIKSKADHAITLKTGPGDVVFCPAYWHDVDPSVFKRIRSTGAKVVILVHDILPVTHEQFYESPWRYEFRNSVVMLSTYTDAIFCVSRFTLDCVVEFLSRQAVDIPPADVAYNGFDPLVPQAGQRLIETQSTTLSRSAGVSVIRERRPYLMVGSVEPKKGHLPTLYCFESMWTAGLDRDLVIVGRKGWMDREISSALEHSAYYGDKLHWYSDFDDFDLADAYIHSHALIFSSVAEGFGIPLIEAASYGRPLVVRETAIAREIVGDAALYFTDAGSLVSRIIELEDSDGYDGACRRATSVRWPTWNECSQSLFERLNVLAGPSPIRSGSVAS